MSNPIWPNDKKISVLGVTGPHASGKTMFLLTICRGPKTRIYDIELSSEDYDFLGHDRVGMPERLLTKYPNGYDSKLLYEAWVADLKRLKPGEFDVIAVDPIDKLEDGLVESVKSRFKEFGFSSAEAFASTKGIFWARVNSEYEQTILLARNKCQVFAFSTHLKLEWKSGQPTTKLIPRGKDPLMALSQLYLFLNRDVVNGVRSILPSAQVLKGRLLTEMPDGSIQPILPDKLPKATADAIRAYIANPPNFNQLKEEEKIQPYVLSEEERLEMQLRIAEAQRMAAEKQVEAGNLEIQTEDLREKARQRMRPGKTTPLPPTTVEPEVKVEPETPAEKGISIILINRLLDKANSVGKKETVEAAIRKRLEAIGKNQDDYTGLDLETFERYSEYLEKFQTLNSKEGAE